MNIVDGSDRKHMQIFWICVSIVMEYTNISIFISSNIYQYILSVYLLVVIFISIFYQYIY